MGASATVIGAPRRTLLDQAVHHIQLVMAWSLWQPHVDVAIVGAKTPIKLRKRLNQSSGLSRTRTRNHRRVYLRGLQVRDVDIAILGQVSPVVLCIDLAKNGRSVVIVDRGKHPRFAIGESTTPAQIFCLHHIADRYGLTELLPLARYGSWVRHHPHVRCGCKRGFSYVWHGDGGEYVPTSDHRNELMVTANASREVADTQWYRPMLICSFFARHNVRCIGNRRCNHRRYRIG